MAPAAIVKEQMTNPDDHPAAPSPAEIWLRGNLRPVATLAAVALAVLGGLGMAVALTDSSPLVRWLVVIGGGLAAASIVGLAVVAARPRLERVGDALRIRLSPTAVQEVPLAAVECFFPGSQPLARDGTPTCGDHAAFRVNTLVMRLAERAADYQQRATFTPWGTWDDGYVVFDGRWCEPLSAELSRQLSRQLLDARRLLSTGTGAAAGPPPGSAS
jgi:hypothetical protein